MDKVAWNRLENDRDLDLAIAKGQNAAVLFFKHSTRCPVSSMALRMFERDWPGGSKLELYFLDLIAHRDLSNRIARELGVDHESPQAIVLRDGLVVYAESHNFIAAKAIHEAAS